MIIIIMMMDDDDNYKKVKIIFEDKKFGRRGQINAINLCTVCD